MPRLLFAIFFSTQALTLLGQDQGSPKHGKPLPFASRVFVSVSQETQPKEIAPAPPAAAEVVPTKPPMSPNSAPPISENGAAKDTSETKIYTPLPVEAEAFPPQDPFLYQEGETPVSDVPVGQTPTGELFGSSLEIPADIETPYFRHQPSWTNSVGGNHCAPVIRRCVSDSTERWATMYVAGLFLHRSAPRSRELFRNTANPLEQFDASDFDFSLDNGIEAGFVAHRFLNELDVDIRYFSVNDAVSQAQDRFTGGATRVNMQTPINIDGPRNIFAAYETSLGNVEANLRFRYGGGWNWTTFIAGFRYLNLEESITARFVDPVGIRREERVRSRTDNDLYGFQVGMNKTLTGNRRFNVDGYWRLGLYNNSSSSGVSVTSITSPPGRFSAQGGGSQRSFSGELGLKGRYAITRCLNAFGSYQLLMIDDVALASNQLAAANTTTRAGHDSRSRAYFQGVSFGLEYNY